MAFGPCRCRNDATGELLGAIFIVLGIVVALGGLLFLVSDETLDNRLVEARIATSEVAELLSLIDSITDLTAARSQTEALKRRAQRTALAAFSVAVFAYVQPWW